VLPVVAEEDVEGAPLSKRDMWASDDFGGFEAHVPVDKGTEGDGAEAYVEEDPDAAPVVSLSASNNTLTVVRKRPDVLTFVRYVNGHAPGSRFDIDLVCDAVDPEEGMEE
jgi:hypothetical protein